MADLQTSSDNTFTPSDIQVESVEYLTDVVPFADAQNAERIQQQKITPTSIPARGLTELVTVLPGGNLVYRGVASTIPNNTSAIFLTSIADPQGRLIAAVPEVSWRVNNFAYATSGAGVGFRLAPLSAFFSHDDSNGTNLVYYTTMTNLSGNTLTNVAVYIRFRVIANPSLPSGSTASVG